ncbi:uncharacterized protein LOC143288523 isoform X2 [Babylonia areolata]|uniref:uncharacterized protein LOC143288523 isoform X2 n=1 Tax=Babylonia areolata TaxID=304850 RepID=UPI003FD5D45C
MMTSDQQEPDLNSSVQKPGTGLNPYADAFFCSKTLTTPAEKSWEPGEEFLTNGDLSVQDEVGGGFSSGDSPVSDSPPAPTLDGSLEAGAGAPPPEFVPDSLVGTMAPMPLVLGTEADSPLVGEDLAESLDQTGESVPPLDMAMVVNTVTIPNGLGPAAAHQGSAEGVAPGAQVSESSTLNSAPSDLRTQLQSQLEYYFSRDNLVQDHYLRSQMDGDQYVPITTIANFNQVVKLTTNYDFIVEVLKSSKAVQVDETGTKVRPRLNRTVLMLREIPENTPKSEVESLFQHEKCPKLVHCEFAHNGYWYVTFNTDEDAASAYCFLRERNVMFRNKPVLARIKARPLVRPGGGGHYMNKAPNQPQQDAAVPFMRQQQAQFPIMAAPVPQFVNQQQVPQPVSPFHLYNLQTMLPQWPNTAAPTFLDPGAMLSMNGLQATAVKPSTNHSRNLYHHPVRSNNNRGCRPCYRMGKPHHRPQSISTDKVQESRPLDRTHSNHLPSTRTSPRNNSHQQHAPELLSSQPPPFARSRSEGSSGNSSHFNSTMPSSVSSAPTPLVPPEDSLHLPAQASNTKGDSVSSVQHKRGNYRKSRRNEDGAKNSRANASHGGAKEGKPHEPQFELEATSFPPLPGSSNNSSSGDAPEGSKLSDVVKGTTRPNNSRSEDRVAKASPNLSVASTPALATVSAPGPIPVTDMVTCPVVTSPVAVSPLVAGAAASPAVVKEVEVAANGNHSHPVHPASTSATAVDSSAHTSKTSKTSSQPSSSPATKPSSESSTTPKQATISTTPVKGTVAPTPAADVAPARLSYAQMVARKQQAENVAKQNSEEGGAQQATPPAAARTTAQTTLREQSQTQASASVSASAPPKSASASANARPPSKEGLRKDFEPKEQRFSGGRGAKENRNSRQPRFDRRRVDRDVKVPAK